MTFRSKNRLSLTLAGLLPFMPLVRAALPMLEFDAPPTAALILRWVVGLSVFGYDAVSKASSVAISPPTATVGVEYYGTITYSGGHAGAVLSMSVSGNCLGSYALAPGLTVTYNGGNTATISGAPTGSTGTLPLTVKVYDGPNCTGGLTDTRSTSLIIQSAGGGNVAPTMTVTPQSVVAQAGSDVILSGGASGNPNPAYYWQQGINAIPGAGQNTLLLPSAQLNDSGVYTLYATNSQGSTSSACYLTVALTPGNNPLGLFYTNYAKAGAAVTMTSFITNVPSAVNTYSWQFNNSSIGITTSNLNLTASQTLPNKSGTYSVTFNSVVNTTTVVNDQQYNSYWVFGYPPIITNQPAGESVAPGGNATFTCTIAGGNYSGVMLYQNGTNLVAQTNLAAYNPAFSSLTTNISFTISNVTQANAGVYSFIATNYWGANSSSNAALTVSSPLTVTSPQSQTNYAGKNITLNVSASGGSFYTYQWQENGLNLSGAGNISGVLSSNLLIAPATMTNSGGYDVVVNGAGGSVTSSVAYVSIVPVPELGLALNGTNVNLNASGGLVGSNYIVDVSTNLADTNGWMPVLTNAVPANGPITFTDTHLPATSDRFYRLQFP